MKSGMSSLAREKKKRIHKVRSSHLSKCADNVGQMQEAGE